MAIPPNAVLGYDIVIDEEEEDGEEDEIYIPTDLQWMGCVL